MSRIKILFDNLKSELRAGFIAYICAGDPNLDISEQLVYRLEQSGVDLIELGVPFSDPIADGPTIQRAAQRALKNKIKLNDILQLVKQIREKSNIPIILMGYYNPFYHYGLDKFIKNAVQAGVDGLIIPDLPPEEADEYIQIARFNGLNTIFLLAPTSTDARIQQVKDISSGFIYYVSLTGVTGTREIIQSGVKSALLNIRKYTDIPICVGFGISNKKQVSQIADWGADGIIIGSAIVKRIEENIGNPDLINIIGTYVSELVNGLPKNNYKTLNSKR